ncbi:excalibur calcium-binding domain-containing protein [Mycobacterium sp. 1465703.0]|uniref:excalibur calcium-binding domain-containing protein n=1 Tax=Mycobacterium sp. 1465703.0 TaxID=1834078 RepID=UPI000AC5EACB|nr:excalibur calcium-binding domain-containing protein [Mycobacterium sp. 1465703.0]
MDSLSTTAARDSLHAASPSASRLAIYYKKCADAHPDGRCDIPEDDPAYRLGLDKDHNGIACESRKA